MKCGGLLHRFSPHPSSQTKAALAAQNLTRRDFSADAPNHGWQIACTSSVWAAGCIWQRFWTSPLFDFSNLRKSKGKVKENKRPADIIILTRKSGKTVCIFAQ